MGLWNRIKEWFHMNDDSRGSGWYEVLPCDFDYYLSSTLYRIYPEDRCASLLHHRRQYVDISGKFYDLVDECSSPVRLKPVSRIIEKQLMEMRLLPWTHRIENCRRCNDGGWYEVELIHHLTAFYTLNLMRDESFPYWYCPMFYSFRIKILVHPEYEHYHLASENSVIPGQLDNPCLVTSGTIGSDIIKSLSNENVQLPWLRLLLLVGLKDQLDKIAYEARSSLIWIK